ncbi:MAG: c-type cytochrome [Epsilonproteobacteria bacterium]|nr:c-type cytochrome [Campylobacterota bacterium]
MVLAQSSFITQMEYSSLLYKNPRGIGCNKCHGDKGEGKLIAKYKETKKVKDGEKYIVIKLKKELRAPAIDKLSYAEFYKALNTNIQGMPKYYLTEKEIKALFFYLQQINMEK